MRLISNKESVAKGEVSVLAIVETILAMSLVFYLSAHFNTLRWLAVAMCVSPLLLLRTEKSTRLGIKWYDWWDVRVVEPLILSRNFFPNMVLGGIAFGFSPTIVRVSATISSGFTEPLETFRAIPRNWARIALAMDTRQPPEMIPAHPKWTLHYMRRLCSDHERTPTIMKLVGFPMSFVIWFLPALFYRWSLKATSIVYAPLVFVAHSTFSESKDVKTKLELYESDEVSRIRVLYGVVAIAAFVVKLIWMINWNGFVDAFKGNPAIEFLAIYIAPAEIPIWQIAELANSALAIGAMYFVRRALRHYQLNVPWPEKRVNRILGFVSGLRWMLALYAIVCVGFITWHAAQHWHLPKIGSKWVPW